MAWVLGVIALAMFAWLWYNARKWSSAQRLAAEERVVALEEARAVQVRAEEKRDADEAAVARTVDGGAGEFLRRSFE